MGASTGSSPRLNGCLHYRFKPEMLTRPYLPTLAENNAGRVFSIMAVFFALKDALPQYLKDPVTFLYLSGWRVSEMRAIEARDYTARKVLRLRPEISKNKEGRILPVDDELLSPRESMAQQTSGLSIPLSRRRETDWRFQEVLEDSMQCRRSFRDHSSRS